ncbi:MAG: DUF4349 domain-containing protein, partial [Spirochaetales bacterium]|nr:DUF4349 domain-containing protein [Spirochaetales bacterium]
MKFFKKIYTLQRHFRILLSICIILLITCPVIFLSRCSKQYDMGDDFSPREKGFIDGSDDYSLKTDTSGDWEESEPHQPGQDDRSKNEWASDKDTNQNKKEKQEEPDERMKVYFGFLHLRVDNIQESRSAISSLADETGGYVETSYENTIIIRIPKELFNDILARLMNMGEVLNKSIETYDVTDFFRDLAARLEIAKKTRDRLYNLLEKTKDVKERLKILKEIR